MKVLPSGLSASIAAAETLCTLVKLTLLTGRVIALADHDADVTLGGITYTASLAFELSSIAVHSGTQNSSLELSMLLDAATADRDDILSGQLDRAKCEVFVCDYANPGNGAGLYYAGRVQQIDFNDDITATLQINSLLDQNVQLAFEQFSYTCTADLGDARCKVDINSKSKTFVVSAPSSGQLFQTDLTDDDKFWNTGLVEFTSGLNEGFAVEVGQYTKQGGVVVLKLPFPYGLVAGDTGIMHPGCDKTTATCLNTYNNIANYRGVPIGIDPSIGNGATTLDDGSGGLPLDQQPPGKVGVYNTFDGSFGWYPTDGLPPLPTKGQRPPGVPANEQAYWAADTARQFPRFPARPGITNSPDGSNEIYVGNSGGAAFNKAQDTSLTFAFGNVCDSAVSYGAKFQFNGFIYVLRAPFGAPSGGVS